MKANEMPERIYIFDYNDAMVTPLEGDTTYVREDAFIEKAEKAMIEWAGTYISKTTGGGVRERKVLATDLLNYFKKYMKGE